MYRTNEKMKNRKIDSLIAHIEELEAKLSEADNNLRYIKVLQALKHQLDKLSDLLSTEEAQRAYSYQYHRFFLTYCGWSFYERVLNSILDYQYGNRPY